MNLPDESLARPSRTQNTNLKNMIRPLKAIALFGVIFCLSLISLQAKPVPIIFDTDMGNDVDDALALAMAHSLESLGECKILAVTVNKDNPYAGVFCDIINTFYGRPEIPLGNANGSRVTPEAGHFVEIASERRLDDGRYAYARRATFDKPLPEGTRVIRKALAQAEDNSVVFVVIGFSTNMARLLKSPADDISPLTGAELLDKKGKLVSIMAGDFSPEKIAEWNVKKDVPSAREFYRDCPIPMVFSGVEIGKQVLYPWSSIESDYQWSAYNPIIDAYKLYRKGKAHDRPAWDMFAMLYAVRPSEAYYSLSQSGKVAVADEKGTTVFTPSAEGKHRHMMPLTPEQQQAVLKEFLELSARPVD